MVRSSRPRDRRPPGVLLVCPAHGGLSRAAAAIHEQGFTTRHVESTYRAIIEQSRSPAEVVIVDITPLVDSELEVFEVFRSLRPGPLLLASLPPSARHKGSLALERGADAYVVEPFEASEIRLLFERSVERVNAGRAGEPSRDKLAALSHFAAGVAHEINNPLTTISGWLQLALDDAQGDDASRTTFETMHEEVERIAGVVRNLLNFAGLPPGDEQPVDVNELLRDVLAGFEGEHVVITTSLADDLPLILASREQIRTACRQVVHNALTSLDGQGELKVATRAVDAEDQVAIEIADDGCGIPESTLPRIFDPFFSGSESSAGLGLSAAYGIVRGHGGTIEVVSREHEGTRFILRLPLHRLRHKNRILDYVR